MRQGGESFNVMKHRLFSYIKEYENNKDDTILFVAHEGCIRALLSQVYNCNFTDSVCDTSSDFIYKFLIDKNDFQLVDVID